MQKCGMTYLFRGLERSKGEAEIPLKNKYIIFPQPLIYS